MLNHRKRQIYVFRGAAAVRHARLKRKAHLAAAALHGILFIQLTCLTVLFPGLPLGLEPSTSHHLFAAPTQPVLLQYHLHLVSLSLSSLLGSLSFSLTPDHSHLCSPPHFHSFHATCCFAHNLPLIIKDTSLLVSQAILHSCIRISMSPGN